MQDYWISLQIGPGTECPPQIGKMPPERSQRVAGFGEKHGGKKASRRGSAVEEEVGEEPPGLPSPRLLALLFSMVNGRRPQEMNPNPGHDLL